MTPYEAVREQFKLPFDLRPYQVHEVNDLAPRERVGYYWQPGCVDSLTEYLTPSGWRPICTYKEGKVAQYLPETGAIEFVDPTEYIVAPCDKMIRIRTLHGVDQLLSPEHRVLLRRTGRDEVGVSTAQDLLEQHDAYRAGVRTPRGHSTKATVGVTFNCAAVPTAFSAPSGKGIPMSDEDLRLQVAVIADGHFSSSTRRVVIRIKKERKVERLRALLTQAGTQYCEVEVTEGIAAGYHVFSFLAPLRLKEFDCRFWEADLSQRALLAQEVIHWDGSVRRGARGPSFSSTSKASADFVQYLWACEGFITRLCVDERAGKYRGGVCYTVNARGGTRGGRWGLLHLRNRKAPTMWEEPSTDGFKYCFTVPSSYLLLRRNGCIFATGNSGKTSASTVHALYQRIENGVDTWLVTMPPILLYQWEGWLKSVTNLRTGKPLTCVVYHGPPKKRATLDLNVEFILTTTGMLKNDYEHLEQFLSTRNYGVLLDEAELIKNIRSDTHKAVAGISDGRPLQLLTGTPITKPGDAYAYIKLVAPGVYRNKRQFDRLHVGEVDEYGNVESWINLGLLAENMKVNTSRVLRREVRSDLPPVVYTRVAYKLDPAHMALYRRIAEERLVEFENGEEIDAISASALRSALQQVIINWGEFDENPDRVPEALALVEEYLDELGDKKLAVVANFRRSNAYLLQALRKYGAVAVYGDISPAAKQEAIRRFINDPKCRVILLQPASAGRGVDGLQHVCSDMLVLEAPTTAPPFEQVVARLDRDGQEDVVNCRIAVAQGTVQVRMFNQLLDNDATANKVQRGYKDLKDSIYGE